VTGGVFAVVALGLDDRAADPGEEEPTADQVAGDRMDRTVEKLDAEALGAQVP
jgi:hypothetical protein